MFKTELLEFDIGPPPLPPMLSKTEFAIKFAGSDSVLGNAVSKRPLSWLIHRSNAIFI